MFPLLLEYGMILYSFVHENPPEYSKVRSNALDWYQNGNIIKQVTSVYLLGI